jgi:soluble lytic murein transglycosylase-like protein
VRRFAAKRRVVKRRDSLGGRRSRYASLIETVARQFKLDEELLHAVVRAESAYNPKAVSSAGAIGLMQLMPATAERYGVNDIWNPTQNLRGGARYLRDLLEQFDDDLMLALAAYNAGEGAVMRYGNRIPPYPETRNYVFKVIGFLQRARTNNAGA